MSEPAKSVIWELQRRRPDGTPERHSGLSTDDIRWGLYQGAFQGDDQARRDPSAAWRDLSTYDEFDGHVPETDRRRHRQGFEEESVDMTPMIDVTFLLLIFFMITASFHLQKGLDFPAAATQEPPVDPQQPLPGLRAFEDRIIMEISEFDIFRMKSADGTVGPAIDPSALVEQIRLKSQQEKKGKLLIIPHELSSHEATVTLIDSSARAGVLDISIADVTTPWLNSSGAGNLIRQ